MNLRKFSNPFAMLGRVIKLGPEVRCYVDMIERNLPYLVRLAEDDEETPGKYVISDRFSQIVVHKYQPAFWDYMDMLEDRYGKITFYWDEDSDQLWLLTEIYAWY